MVEAQRAAEEGATARREAERLQAEIAATEPPAPHPSRVELTEKATAPSDGQSDVFEQLTQLAELRDAGVLTEEEFSQKKTDLLARM